MTFEKKVCDIGQTTSFIVRLHILLHEDTAFGCWYCCDSMFLSIPPNPLKQAELWGDKTALPDSYIGFHLTVPTLLSTINVKKTMNQISLSSEKTRGLQV